MKHGREPRTQKKRQPFIGNRAKVERNQLCGVRSNGRVRKNTRIRAAEEYEAAE